MDLKSHIESIPGYPKEGVIFRDITPILSNPEALEQTANDIAAFAKEVGATHILAPEARGFMFGIPAAIAAKLPFVPVRKPGKLPRAVIEETYELEYGVDHLQMHADALTKGSKVLIVDDLLATGGTVKAIANLVRRCESEVVGYAFVVELDDLHGRDKLGDAPMLSLVHYEGE